MGSHARFMIIAFSLRYCKLCGELDTCGEDNLTCNAVCKGWHQFERCSGEDNASQEATAARSDVVFGISSRTSI